MAVVVRTCKLNPGHFPTKPHEIQVPGNTAFCTSLPPDNYCSVTWQNNIGPESYQLRLSTTQPTPSNKSVAFLLLLRNGASSSEYCETDIPSSFFIIASPQKCNTAILSLTAGSTGNGHSHDNIKPSSSIRQILMFIIL